MKLCVGISLKRKLLGPLDHFCIRPPPKKNCSNFPTPPTSNCRTIQSKPSDIYLSIFLYKRSFLGYTCNSSLHPGILSGSSSLRQIGYWILKEPQSRQAFLPTREHKDIPQVSPDQLLKPIVPIWSNSMK